MSTKVCLVLTEKTIEKNLSALEKYKKFIDIAELRVDYLNQSEILYLRNFPERAGIPCILTVRRKSDGGNFTGGEGARMTIFARGLAFANSDPIKNFAYIDLESDFDSSGIEEAAMAFDIKIIRSLHSKVPVKNIVKTIEGLSRFETDIPKLAFTANCLNDVSELFKASKLIKNQEYILSVMGPYGLNSRILSNKLNSQIVYTFTPEYIKKNKLEQALIDPETHFKIYSTKQI